MTNNTVFFDDHLAAWRDFYDHVRPTIWAGLSRDERRELNTAERDYLGKRGKSLGADRVEALLRRFAPGVYGFEKVVRFWRVGDGGGELSPPDNPG